MTNCCGVKHQCATGAVLWATVLATMTTSGPQNFVAALLDWSRHVGDTALTEELERKLTTEEVHHET